MAVVVVLMLLVAAAGFAVLGIGPVVMDRLVALVQADATGVPTPQESATSPAPLDVTFDDDGRPFDVPLPDGFEVIREDLVRLQLPSGWVAITPGEALPWLEADDPELVRVHLGDPGRYLVEVVWLQLAEAPDTRRPAGLILRASDQPVHRWERFEYAYGTDAGIGAISTPEYHRRNAGRNFEALEAGDAYALGDRFIDSDEPILIDDLDGVSGPDTILFDNGFGDGGYPQTRGVDADGRLAAVAIWHLIAPWRLANLEGTPPPDVTTRESEMIDCLRGQREVTAHGSCTSGSEPSPDPSPLHTHNVGPTEVEQLPHLIPDFDVDRLDAYAECPGCGSEGLIQLSDVPDVTRVGDRASSMWRRVGFAAAILVVLGAGLVVLRRRGPATSTPDDE